MKVAVIYAPSGTHVRNTAITHKRLSLCRMEFGGSASSVGNCDVGKVDCQRCLDALEKGE